MLRNEFLSRLPENPRCREKGARGRLRCAYPAQQSPRTVARVCNRTLQIGLSGAEEYEPDHQHRKAGRNSEQGKHRRAGFGLACFGRGLDDLIMSSRCHGTLDSRMLLIACDLAYQGKRMMPCHVPDLALATSTCGAWQGQGQAALASCQALVPAPFRTRRIQLTPLTEFPPRSLETRFPGVILSGRCCVFRSIPWPPAPTGKAFCAFRS